jgi:RNA recognition motif-containing protein
VKGLSFQAYQSDIEDLFNPFGNVLSVRLLTRDDGKSKGLAFVKFSSKNSFRKAL